MSKKIIVVYLYGTFDKSRTEESPEIVMGYFSYLQSDDSGGSTGGGGV